MFKHRCTRMCKTKLGTSYPYPLSIQIVKTKITTAGSRYNAQKLSLPLRWFLWKLSEKPWIYWLIIIQFTRENLHFSGIPHLQTRPNHVIVGDLSIFIPFYPPPTLKVALQSPWISSIYLPQTYTNHSSSIKKDPSPTYLRCFLVGGFNHLETMMEFVNGVGMTSHIWNGK